MSLSGPNGTWRASDPDRIEYEVTGWAVYYADGAVFRSSAFEWEGIPRAGVQVVMLHHAGGRRSRVANCDEYVLPGHWRTLLGLEIDFGEYERISDVAQNDPWRATP